MTRFRKNIMKRTKEGVMEKHTALTKTFNSLRNPEINPGTRVTGSCQLPNLGASDEAQVPLQEQYTILTADPSHWHQEQ